MKKSLIALAVLAAAGVASAQSSVTLGGIIKEGVGRTKVSGATLPVPAGTVASGSNIALIDGSSRMLISGVEDLGGGTAAYFQIDTRFRPDDNTAASVLASGNTFVGLRGGWGSFQAGKLDTHYCTSVNDDIAGNGTAIALQASSCALNGYVNGSGGGRSVAVASRSVNSLRYTTPNMAGFTGMLSYSFNPYGGERAVNVNTGSRGSAVALALNYDQGPLAVRFSHYTHKATTTGTAAALATIGADVGGTGASQRNWILGVGYDFGIAKVGLTYDRAQLRDLTAGVSAGLAGADTAQRSNWTIPVTVPVGPGALIASFTKASNVKLGVGGTVAGTDAKLFSVGYNYALSKRTSLGASYSRLNNGAAGAYQLYTNTSLGNAGLAPVPAGMDQSLFYIGARHVF